MRIMKLWRIAFMVLAVFSIASCSKEDGDWDPMEWNADTPVGQKDGIYSISADEGTFTFTCRNYSKPWFAGAKDNGKDILPAFEERGGCRLMSNDNFRAEIQGNKLTIDFKANESDQTRSFSFTVTAGDIFYTFYFKQSANAAWQSPCEVKYSIFAICDDLLKFYDITVEYLDIDGQQHTEAITGNRWDYAPAPVRLVDAPEEYKCRIVAVLKEDLPELTEDYYEIGYGVDVSTKVLDADGNVVFKVKQPQLNSLCRLIEKNAMQSLLKNTKEIEIATFSPTINKQDIVALFK